MSDQAAPTVTDMDRHEETVAGGEIELLDATVPKSSKEQQQQQQQQQPQQQQPQPDEKVSKDRTERMPVLIVPGFMSSGLQVESSSVQPRWVGKKLWISLSRLGFTGKFLGKDTNLVFNGGKNNQEEESQVDTASGDDVSNSNQGQDVTQLKMRDDWLAHILLDTDMTCEQPGVKIRAVPGLAGCEYLEDNALVKGDTYVFGCLTNYLVDKGGYTRGKDLDARPYDWRVPFAELEARDKYLSGTLDRIEQMSKECGNRRIALISHSMGVNVGHYLLNFAEKERGRSWIDNHIDTYMVLGGPHLGAAVATASIVNGDSMGLPSALLRSDTALLMGRSFGSTLALQMVQPDGTASRKVAGMKNASLVTRSDILDVAVGSIDLSGIPHSFRTTTKVRVRILIKGKSNAALTNWVPITGSQVVPPQGGKLEIAIPNHENVSSDVLLVQVLIDDLSNENEANMDLCCCCCPKSFSSCCWCLFCCPCFCLGKILKTPLQGLYLGAANTIDLAAIASQGGSIICEKEVPLSTFGDWDAISAPKDFTVQAPTIGTVRSRRLNGVANIVMKARHRTEASFLEEVGVRLEAEEKSNLPFEFAKTEKFLPVTTLDLFRMEKLQGHIAQWEKLEKDPLFNTNAPPVEKVCAIYGINLPTDIRHVYRRCTKGSKNPIFKAFKTFELDPTASLPKDYLERNKYKFVGGKVKETKDTPQIDILTGEAINRSGDGTVPYDSLQHVKTWTPHCQVDVTELDGAEHRACLKDNRLLEAVLARVAPIMEEPSGEQPPLPPPPPAPVSQF